MQNGSQKLPIDYPETVKEDETLTYSALVEKLEPICLMNRKTKMKNLAEGL